MLMVKRFQSKSSLKSSKSALATCVSVACCIYYTTKHCPINLPMNRMIVFNLLDNKYNYFVPMLSSFGCDNICNVLGDEDGVF